jgi:hypothetical protein
MLSQSIQTSESVLDALLHQADPTQMVQKNSDISWVPTVSAPRRTQFSSAKDQAICVKRLLDKAEIIIGGFRDELGNTLLHLAARTDPFESEEFYKSDRCRNHHHSQALVLEVTRYGKFASKGSSKKLPVAPCASQSSSACPSHDDSTRLAAQSDNRVAIIIIINVSIGIATLTR